MSNSIFVQSSNLKIGVRLSKCDIQTEFECQNMISNIRMRYSAPIRMSKYDFEYQDEVFGPNSNVKI